MTRPTNSMLIALAGACVIGAGLWWGFKERPVLVDTATATRAPMDVTIEEDGKTRVQEIYRVSAPISGRLERSLLDVGNKVAKGETVVATIRPMPPAFMDERSLSEAQAGVASARASVALAEADLERAFAALNLAEDTYQRAQKLATSQTIPQAQLDQARADLKVALAVVESARAQVEFSKAQQTSAEARLIQPSDSGTLDVGENCCVHVLAPIDGAVLSLAVKSEQVLAAGSQIAELGDPGHLEVVADLLSTDAVTIQSGTPARITDWGGPPVNATVHSIDPAGFTKISALGIEEQRVNAVLRLTDPAAGLGHDYHVRVALQVWQQDDVLQLPLTALFRDGSRWATFVLHNGRAVLTALEVGRMNTTSAQVLGGLNAGAEVIVFPSDKISDGTRVAPREPTLD